MKRLLAIIASTAIVSACGGAPPNEQILTQQCSQLFSGDARTMGMISRQAETNLASFCECYAAKAVSSPALVDEHKMVLNAMNELKAEGGDVEAVAEQIEEMAEDGSLTDFSKRELDALGDYFQELAEEMGEAGGMCPV